MKALNKLYLFLSVLIFIGIFGCSSSKEQKEIPEEKSTADKFKFEYNFNIGDVLTYKVDMNVKQIITMMGQEQVIGISSSQNYVLNIVGKTEEGFEVEFYVDSLTLDSDNPQVSNMLGDVSYFLRKKCSGILKKNGEIKDISEIDKIEIPDKLKQLSDQFNPKKTFSKFLLIFPEKMLGIGDTWTEQKDDSVDNMGNKIHVKATVDYKIAEKLDYEGYNAYKIVSTLKLAMEGKGSQMGQEFNITGTGKADAEYYFVQNEGKLLTYRIEQTNDTNAEITGMNMTIPMTTITTTNLKLIK